MNRYTTPDKYTIIVKQLWADRCTKRISGYVFAVAVGRIFGLRHAGS